MQRPSNLSEHQKAEPELVVVDISEQSEVAAAANRQRWWQGRWLRVVSSLSALLCVCLFFAAEYTLHHAEPILRKRILETLSDRFHAPVALDRISISLLKGIEVDGYGLRIPYGQDTDGAPSYPMIAVQHFAFRTTLRSLWHQPTYVAGVHVEGMELHISPPEQRRRLLGTGQHAAPAGPGLRPKIAIIVKELHCSEVRLFLESGKPGKDPLLFRISKLDMRDVGQGEAMLYDAVLTNPKPTGLIHATGHFGPWANAKPDGDPGQTPLDGNYTFDHADLNSIKGIGGTLSSSGRFTGVLDNIVIDGDADVPDFALDLSSRPVPLHTHFHAVVDGTSGDTYLQPVEARLLNSEFTTSGKVVKVKGRGHDIELDVNIPHGRMQDFLLMAVKTTPPLMNGILQMKAKLHIPPGGERVPIKMVMTGSFHLLGVRFNRAKMQDRLDGLSARAQGHPQEAAAVSRDREAEVKSRLSADFTMGHGLLTVRNVNYGLPGATVLLNGVYSMDGKLFEFKGHVQTQATASEMVTGWKSWLLKPVDPFLRKNGAGVQLPIEITGTEGDMHFGLALHGTDETPEQMLADVRQKEHDKQEFARIQREMKAADAEDEHAAQAKTLEEAERAHNAAVKRRADAWARLHAAEKNRSAPER